MRTAARSATRAPPATWPPSTPAAVRRSWWRPRPSAAAPSTSASSIILGDGAAWIWNLADQHFPARHPDRGPLPRPRAPARPRRTCSPSCSATDHDEWLADRLRRTRRRRHRRPSQPPPATTPSPASKPRNWTRPWATSRHNAHRMRYQHFRNLGMFVGSGAVEAGMQGDHRPAPQTVRHALDHRRRDRHPHPALPARQRPLGRNLAAAAQPVRSGLSPASDNGTHSDHPGQRRLPASHLHSCPTPTDVTVTVGCAMMAGAVDGPPARR